jgi:archaellum component FlaC
MRECLNQLTKAETLLREITGRRAGGKRKRRGVFNFIGELSKILFGTMDDDDAKFYNEQIKLFEQNSEDMTTLLKQQLSVVKSSLGAINNTLTDVEYNEKLLKEGINKVTAYMNTLKSETEQKMDLFSAKIEVEGHIMSVNSAMGNLQRKIDLLMNSVVNAPKGILQPQVISPVTLMDALLKSAPAFPKDTTLPFPLSKDSAHLLSRHANCKCTSSTVSWDMSYCCRLSTGGTLTYRG